MRLLMGLTEGEAKAIAAECGRRGVYFVLNVVDSEPEGEQIMRRALDW